MYQKAIVVLMESSSLQTITCEVSPYSLCCSDIDCFRSNMALFELLRSGHRHTNNSHRGETCSAVNEQHVEPKNSEMNRISVTFSKG